ncbi:MAG: RDD family protein [Bdellovibrio sp.]
MDEVYVPSTWKRLAALTIDQMMILPFYLPFAKKFFSVFFTDDDVYLSLVQLLVLFMVPALFEFLFLVVMQATPGKWIMGLKVVPQENPFAELHWAQCVMRPLAGRLSFFFAWGIYALAFFRYDRTHLADWLAETRVIQFVPRVRRAKVRWIWGLFFVLMYSYEGLNYSSAVLNEIDWGNHQVDLRALVDVGGFADIQFEDFDDYDL